MNTTDLKLNDALTMILIWIEGNTGIRYEVDEIKLAPEPTDTFQLTVFSKRVVVDQGAFSMVWKSVRLLLSFTGLTKLSNPDNDPLDELVIEDFLEMPLAPSRMNHDEGPVVGCNFLYSADPFGKTGEHGSRIDFYFKKGCLYRVV